MILRAGDVAFSASHKRCGAAFFRISTARERSAPPAEMARSLARVRRFRATISERNVLLICLGPSLFCLEFILRNGRVSVAQPSREPSTSRAPCSLFPHIPGAGWSRQRCRRRLESMPCRSLTLRSAARCMNRHCHRIRNSEIADRARVAAAPGLFQLTNNLHGADFWRAGDGAGGKCRFH